MLNNDNKVKILHVIGSGVRGGAEIFLYSLLKEIVKSPQFSIEVCFTMSRGPVADLIGDLGIETYCLDMKSGFDLVNGIRLTKLIKEGRYDLIHSHTGQLVTCLAISLASQSARIMTEHGNVISHFPVRRRMGRYLLRRMLRSYKYLVAVSESIKKAMVIKYKIPADKIVVIKNGVSLERFSNKALETRELRQKLDLPLHRKIVGAVARLFPEKGIDHLILAAPVVVQKHPDCLFMIAGDGPLRQELEQQVRKAGLSSNFKFLGQRDDIPEILSIVDVLVFPSVREGFPVAVVEGMAMRKPIVAYEVGGIPEAIIDGETGLLVKQRDPILLGTKIVTLLDDKDLCLRIGTKAREIAEGFDISAIAEKYLALYLAALGNKKVDFSERHKHISTKSSSHKIILTEER